MTIEEEVAMKAHESNSTSDSCMDTQYKMPN